MHYDPFERGPFSVGVKTIQTSDPARDGRPLTVEIWYPAARQYAGQDVAAAWRDTYEIIPGLPPVWQAAVRDAAAHTGIYPLIAYSHSSPGHRRQATFLCTHLASHGYVVAAVDHTGNTTLDMLQAAEDQLAEEQPQDPHVFLQRFAELRPADIQFMIDQMVEGGLDSVATQVDGERIGMVGHSFGGWTALMVTALEHRIRATVALAPAGGHTPLPADTLRERLNLRWERDIPTLILGAGQDSMLPVTGVRELFERVEATKKMVILNDADHLHFCDRVEESHEWFRQQLSTAPASDTEAQIILKRIKPMAELCPGEQAHLVVRGLSLAHMDAVLKDDEDAQRLLASDLEGLLANWGVHVAVV